MKKYLFICLLIIVFSALGQSTPDWKINLGAEVKWFLIAPNGTLITGQIEQSPDSISFTRISGIDPLTGKVKWTFDPEEKNQIISGVDILPESKNILIRNVPFTILNPDNGSIIFDLRKDLFISEIFSYGFIEKETKIWIDGNSNDAHVFYYVDLQQKKLTWSNSEIFDSPGTANKISIGTKSFTSHKVSVAALLSAPLITQDNIITVTAKGIFSIDRTNGSIKWETALPDPQQFNKVKVDLNQQTVRLLAGENQFYFMKGSNITALNYENGKMSWPLFANTSGPIEQVINFKNSVLVCPGLSDSKGVYGTTKLMLIDKRTGGNKWNEGPSFNGTVTQSVMTPKGLAIAMKNSVDVNSINMVDTTTGNFIWSESAKVSDQLQKLELVPNGLLYITPHTANILDWNGNPITNFPVQGIAKKPIVTYETDELFYFFSSKDNNLYEIDKTKGTGRALNLKPIAFKGEDPQLIEMLNESILLYGKQNATLIQPDGNAKFSLYRPGTSNLMAQLKKDVIEMTSKDVQTESVSNDVNMKVPSNYLYVSTLDNRVVTLMVFAKNSGKLLSSIIFFPADDQPVYQIDKDHGMLFYTPRLKDDYGNPIHVGEIWGWKL